MSSIQAAAASGWSGWGGSWASPINANRGSWIPQAVGATTVGAAAGLAYLYRRELVLWLYERVDLLRPLPESSKVYLSPLHNWGPVKEEVHVVALAGGREEDGDGDEEGQLRVVEGRVPEDLEGAYLRTGPNPMLPVRGSYHWFDGDGMVHALRFKGRPGGNKVLSYSNHAVRTSRLRQELKAGRALMMKAVGELRGALALVLMALAELRGWMGLVDGGQGHGTANTGMVVHAGRILALHEDDLPYQVLLRPDGGLETVGRVQVAGGPASGLGVYPGVVTAHPKVDPLTGELFFFGYDLVDKPWMRAGLMDAHGRLTKQWAVDLPYPASVHDCGLTQSYGVLMMHPLAFDVKNLFKGPEGLPVAWAPHLPTRVGLLRRDAPSAPTQPSSPSTKHQGPAGSGGGAPVQWFNLPTSFVFHVANCWEDDQGLVHVVVCQYGRVRFSLGFPPPGEEDRPQLHRYLLDPSTGKTLAVEKLSEQYVEFPVVNPRYVGQPASRWTWGALMNCTTAPDPSAPGGGVPLDVGVGLGKFDMKASAPGGRGDKGASGQDACVAQVPLPPGCMCLEPIFAPRAGAREGQGEGEEDDGYLLVYVWDMAASTSTLHIYDARTMSPEPLARVRLPQRVPNGLHGVWVTEEQLAAQRATL